MVSSVIVVVETSLVVRVFGTVTVKTEPLPITVGKVSVSPLMVVTVEVEINVVENVVDTEVVEMAVVVSVIEVVYAVVEVAKLVDVIVSVAVVEEI